MNDRISTRAVHVPRDAMPARPRKLVTITAWKLISRGTLVVGTALAADFPWRSRLRDRD